MTYSVQNTDGSRTINVAASQVNSSFSVALVGRNVSGYGQYFVQNSIRHLENFASTSAPSDDILLTGQAWYDKNEEVMRVYDGVGWRRMSITVSATAPSGGVDEGTAYFDTVDDKLKVHNGTAFVDASYAGKVSNEYGSDTDVGSPSAYGTRLRTMYIPDTSTVYHAVLALMYVNDGTGGYSGFTSGESIMAIFSDHAEFTINTTQPVRVEGLGDVNLYNEFNDSDGIGTVIKPGMNLRQKYSGTAIALANVALEANIANAIQTSSANVSADNIIHTGRSYVPTNSNTEELGDNSSRFERMNINKIYLGDHTGGGAAFIGKSRTSNETGTAAQTLDIGESSFPIDNIYATNITLADGGGITGLNVESFGTSSAPIDEAYISNVIVDSSNVYTNSTGFHGDIREPGTGSLIVDVSGGAVLGINTAGTFTNKTFGSDILATSTSINIGNSSTGFGTVYAQTFDGVSAELSGTATAVTFNGNISGATAVFTGTSNAVTFNGTTGNFTGTVTADTFTDSTLSISSGNITGGDSATFSGNVTGDYFVGTATQAQYADLAEIYSADAEYEAGTVVKIGGDAEVTQTESHADTEVFGVVSSSPAYLMNSEAEGVPVALAGRVPVKVIGKVAKGERLVSSDVPGVAWALGDDEYDARAVIGRALQSKEDGDAGVIEAVIGVK